MNAIVKLDINRLARASGSRRSHRSARSGFSITEMLVVVGIIVLLASLLMVAMGRVRNTAKASQTLSTIQNFAAACDAFYAEHGMYPGVIPESVLATQVAMLENNNIGDYTGPITFTSTENALLHLMGGYRLLPPNRSEQEELDYENYGDYEIRFGSGDNEWLLGIKLSDIGEGPIINGKPYAPYYTPGANEVAVVVGQFGATDDAEPDNWVRLPDLIDSWGQPIIYMRQVRNSGPLVGVPTPTVRPQFLFGSSGSLEYGGMTGYIRSQLLGELATNQVFHASNNPNGSILTHPDPNPGRLATFAQIVRHPAFGPPTEPFDTARVVSRGAYVLISAGPDGVFFSASDGPGTRSNPVWNIVDDADYGNPRVVDDYDDIIFFGGG